MSLIFIAGDVSAEENNERILDVEIDHGKLIDLETQTEYYGGVFEKALNLKFLPNDGYEFISWSIDGDCNYSEGGSTIHIESLGGSSKISVNLRNYATSTSLINTVDVDEMPIPGDSLVNAWSFASSNLDMSGNMWYGCPSTPLIVGDYTYVRAGGYLYAIETVTGHVVKYVRSEGLANNFYHYISYGNGVIFDTTGYKAYDLELNYLYDIPTSLRFAKFYDGYFYGCLKSANGFQMYKTSADPDNDLVNGVKANLFTNKTEYLLWAQYGQYSSFLIEGDWIFFPEADGSTELGAYRAITAFNLKTEQSTTVKLPGVGGLPWDDGWLTYYDGYLYITAYVAGLFGGVPEKFKDYYDTIAYVKFDSDTGKFEEPKYKLITTPEGNTFRGVCSGLIIHNGRGYVNARALGTDTLGGSDDTNTCMIAYDIGPCGEPIPRYATVSVMGHGGLVINTAHEGEGKIFVYFLPYNKGSQAVYVFTDELVDGVWIFKSKYDKLSPTRDDWGSQAVRVGANGELVYYVDSGYLDCYVSADRFKITVMEMVGDTATIVTANGANAGTILEKLYRGSSIENGILSYGHTNYVIYGLNEVTGSWDQLNDPYTQQFTGKANNGVVVGTYKYLILLDTNGEKHFSSKGDQGWYYYSEGEYKKVVLYNTSQIDSAVGKSLIYSKTVPSLSDYPVPEVISVNRDSFTELDLPVIVDIDYSVENESIATVEKIGSKLRIHGMTESETVLQLTIGDKNYSSVLKVLPKITIIDENNTISESIILNEDGSKTTSSIEVTVSEDGTESVSITKTYDKFGELTSSIEINTLQTRELNPEDPEQTVPITYTTTIEKDALGIVISDKSSEKTYYVRELERGSRLITTELVVLDNLSGVLTNTTTLVTTDSLYTVTITTIIESRGEEVISKSVSRTVDTAEEDMVVSIDEEHISISLEGTTTADVRSLIESVSAEYDGSISIVAGESVSSDVVIAAAEVGAELSLHTELIDLNISNDSLVDLSKLVGNLLLETKSVNAESLNASQAASVHGASVYSIDLFCGMDLQHEFGTFTMTITCEISPQQNNELKVWRIGDNGEKTYATNVQYKDGKVSFDADHLSLYAVGYESSNEPVPGPSGGDSDGGNNNGMMIYAGIGVVAILAILGMALVVRKAKS